MGSFNFLIFFFMNFFFKQGIVPIVELKRKFVVNYRMSLRCSLLYLEQYRQTSPELLATGDGVMSTSIVGDVFMHRSAKVHPTAKVQSFRPSS